MKQILNIKIQKYVNLLFDPELGRKGINLCKRSIVLPFLVLFVVSLDAQNQAQKIMHISFDDSYSFLIDLKAKQNTYTSIFNNPFLSKLKSYHDTYGAVFSLYCFTYSPGAAWNIAPLTTKFAEEFRDNSNWLKLGFHSRNSNYTAADWKVQYYNDFLSVIPEIEGRSECFDLVPRLHTFALNTTLAFCDSLRDASIGVIGFLSADDSRNSYYLNTTQSSYINHNDSLYDADNNLYFFRTETRLEGVKSMVPFLAQFLTTTYASRANIMPIFSHEYLVYDYRTGLVNKGIFEKIDTCITWAVQNNYKFDFPMNVIRRKMTTGINSTQIDSNIITVKGKTVSSEKAGSFKIFNIAGILQLKQNNVIKIEMKLPSGIYIVDFKGNDGAHATKKIVI